MADGFQCQCQLLLICGGCLEDSIEKLSGAVSRSDRKVCHDQRGLGLGKEYGCICICIQTPKLGAGSGLFHGNPGLQRD